MYFLTATTVPVPFFIEYPAYPFEHNKEANIPEATDLVKADLSAAPVGGVESRITPHRLNPLAGGVRERSRARVHGGAPPKPSEA